MDINRIVTVFPIPDSLHLTKTPPEYDVNLTGEPIFLISKSTCPFLSPEVNILLTVKSDIIHIKL